MKTFRPLSCGLLCMKAVRIKRVKGGGREIHANRSKSFTSIMCIFLMELSLQVTERSGKEESGQKEGVKKGKSREE